MADDVHHPIFARLYARQSPRMEEAGFADLRDDLLAGLRGEVIEVGAGNGLNFARYPAEVTRVLAVEPEPRLREIAERAAAGAGAGPGDGTGVTIEVVDGLADALPAADGSFDAAVASLVLCSVNDVPAALAEIRRVLRPGGELRFLEHVRAETAGLALTQRVLDATVWPLFGGGCHTHRDTLAAIEAAGFTVDRIERLRFPDTRIPAPASPHILGVATRLPNAPR